VAGPIIDAGYRGFDPSAPVVGSPAQVAEQFRAFAALGYTDVIVRPLAGDQAETLACLSRLEAVRAAVVED
jgi:alkanesulfonate monooxygenase SsuD/methylene tetrahydromethanopterin reductase-like flavin-dependent oxidoreductase (luciferase family)